MLPTKSHPSKRCEQAFPQTNTTVTRARTMGQTYPLIRPGPGLKDHGFFLPRLTEDTENTDREERESS